MEINSKLFSVLSLLSENLPSGSPLVFNKDTISLITGSRELIRITSGKILLFGSYDLEPKIINSGTTLPKPFPVQVGKSGSFIKEIAKSGIRLNHLGIRYFCGQPDEELKWYKQLAAQTDFHVYQEESSEEKDRWYFLGDKTDWRTPLFEIILTSKRPSGPYEWTPHFQIDIDTHLNGNELKEIANRCLWPDFYKWQLDDAGAEGTVLFMGMIGVASGTKVCLGIGTKLRDAEYHREHLLKEV